MWENAPDDILERIFAELPPRYRYYASVTCSHWQDVFWSEYAWDDFVFNDTTFTRRRFAPSQGGYELTTDKYRLQLLLRNTGRKWSSIRISPCERLFHL